MIGQDVKELSSIPPLEIPDKAPNANGAKARKVCSYKEMWRKDNGTLSLNNNSLYEAGGSGFWCSVNPDDKLSASASCDYPVHIGSWSQLQKAKTLFQSNQQHKGRVLFPVTLEAVVSTAADIASGGDGASEFPRTLKLVCHHIILAAWWCCMFDALKASDKDRITELYECILTCTIRVAVWTSDAMVMKMALAAAEHARALECTSDNVIVFAERLAIITKASSESSQQKLVDSLKQDGILYQGKPVTRNLLAACESMCKNLTERSKAILSYLESKYGRPLLTDGPTKLYRLIVTSGKFVSNLRLHPKPGHGDAFEMLMASLATALDSEIVASDVCTADFLAGKEKGTSEVPCWALVSMTGIALGVHTMNLLNLMEVDQCSADLKTVMSQLLNPVLWRQELLKQSKIIQAG